MKLYIGGFAQGKLDYVMEQIKNKDCSEILLLDGESAEVFPEKFQGKFQASEEHIVILNHFHLWVRRLLNEKKDPVKETDELLEKFPGIIIISDEIGNGIVPADAFERRYRDCTGELLTGLAKKSERVERILCGLGQILKSN